MGIKERRERERIRRNNDIVDAAERVIFGKGPDYATMEDIAKEAELGKATIYGYYKSKDELLLAINERALNKLASLFREAHAVGSNGMEKVREIGRAYIRFSHEYPNYYHFISLFEMGNMNIDPIKSMENALGCDKILEGAIELGMQDKSIRDDMSPAVLSKMLWGMSTGMIQLLKNRGQVMQELNGIKEEDMYEHFFRMVDTALNPLAKSLESKYTFKTD